MQKAATSIIALFFLITLNITIIILTLDDLYITIPIILSNLILSAMFALLQAIYLFIFIFLRVPNSQFIGNWFAERLNYPITLILLALCLINFVFSLVVMFIEYAHSKQDIGRLWIIQLNIYTSITSWIYAAQIVQSKQLIRQNHNNEEAGNQKNKIMYLFYLALLMIGIGFMSHIVIFSSIMIFSSQIYFQIVMILFSLKVWWKKTPFFLHILIMGLQITSLVYAFIQIPILKEMKIVLTFQVLKCLWLIIHLFVVSFILIRKAQHWIRQNFTFAQKKQGINPGLINLMQKCRIVSKSNPIRQQSFNQLNTSNIQNIKNNQQTNKINIQMEDFPKLYREQIEQCSICFHEIVQYSLVYRLGCVHIFHVDCLSQWALIQNACPTCRQQLI